MKQPFTVFIEQSVLNDLKDRLARTRWPDEPEQANWDYGTNEAYLKELCAYWHNSFDWRKAENHLNTFPHFTTSIEGAGIHFIHAKGEGSRSIPLLLTHGWPDGFIRFLKLIPLLTKADDTGFSFDVVVPSIPGYGFSAIPERPGTNPERIASLFAALMTELGYQQFFAHGGDWGSSITEQIAVQLPERLHGIHLTDVPFQHLFTIPPDDLSAAEKKYLKAGKQWQMTEGAYAMLQSTKPQTLAYGLNDSPAGLAAWIIEKFYAWSDCDGDLENAFTRDELLTNLTIYWATQTINPANRLYAESMRKPSGGGSGKIDVPAAIAIFPKDIVPAPKEFADRIFNVQQWTTMPKGGHFAAMEQPELLSADIRKFAKTLV